MTVTVVVAIFGPKKAFAGTVMKLYFSASWLMLIADRCIRLADPAFSAAAHATALMAADLLTTPWHWCLYNLAGGAKSTLALPIVCYTAYCSCLAMYGYPVAAYPAGTGRYHSVASERGSPRGEGENCTRAP